MSARNGFRCTGFTKEIRQLLVVGSMRIDPFPGKRLRTEFDRIHSRGVCLVPDKAGGEPSEIMVGCATGRRQGTSVGHSPLEKA